MNTHYLPKMIRNRFDKNQNWIGAFVGQTGTGKSWSALRLGEEVDNNFSIDNVVWDGRSFMDLLLSDKLGPRSYVLWDEAGCGLSSREWFEEVNRHLNFVLQVFRYRQIALAFSVPSVNFLDSQARALLHTLIECQAVLPHREVVRCRVLKMAPQLDGAIWRKYYRVLMPSGHIAVMDKYFIGKPSDKIIKQYEVRKQEYGKHVTAEALNIIKQHETTNLSKVQKSKTPAEIANEVLEKFEDDPKTKELLVHKYGGKQRVHRELLAQSFELTEDSARAVKRIVETALGEKDSLSIVN